MRTVAATGGAYTAYSETSFNAIADHPDRGKNRQEKQGDALTGEGARRAQLSAGQQASPGADHGVMSICRTPNSPRDSRAFGTGGSPF